LLSPHGTPAPAHKQQPAQALLIASVFGTLEVPMRPAEAEVTIGAVQHDAYAAWVKRHGPELRRLRREASAGGSAAAGGAQPAGNAKTSPWGDVDPIDVLPFDPLVGVPLLPGRSLRGLAGATLPAGRTAGAVSTSTSCGAGMVTVQHRSVKVCIPAAWFNEYIISTLMARTTADGSAAGVTGPKAAFTALLPAFGAASAVTGVNRAAYERLIGCWNGYRGPESLAVLTGQEEEQGYAFWYEGWGAPWEWAMTMLELIRTYWAFIELPVVPPGVDPFSGSDNCAGDGDNLSFAEFVRELLSGNEAKTRDTRAFVNRCSLTVHFKSYDTRSAVALTREGSATFTGEGCARKATGDCGSGFQFDGGRGLRWDDFEVQFDSSAHAYRSRTEFDELGGYRFAFPHEEENPGGDEVAGIGLGFGLTLRPTAAGFGGFIADRLLFDARMCLDYWNEFRDNAVLVGLDTRSPRW
jgi:hypothetical protein